MSSRIANRKPVLRLFKISDLSGSPVQPERRVSKPRMKALRDAVLLLGFFAYPPLVSEHGEILDGHRRVLVAKEEGLDEIWCIVLPTARIDTFVTLNTSHEGFTGVDWGVAISQGIAPEHLPGIHGRRARELNEIGGKNIFALLSENGLGIGIVDTAKMIAKKVGLNDTDGQRRTLNWLIAYGAQKRAREALATDGQAVLRIAIERNRPLMRSGGDWVAG